MSRRSPCPRAGGRRATALIALGLAAVLAGCAAEVDAEGVRDRARTVFDELVAAAGETDAAVLRTLEVSPESAQACEEEDGARTAFVATGTLSVAADEEQAAATLDALAADLDGSGWSRVQSEMSGQSARMDDDGVLVTLTAQGPLVVIAVLTPCLPSR